MRGKNRIRKIIIENNMTPKELASNADISYSELMRIISYKSSPRFETMILIADALGREVWEVFFDSKRII